jgi:hypothetical protein
MLFIKAAALIIKPFGGSMEVFLLACILAACSLAGVSFHPKYDALIKRVVYTVLLVIAVWVIIAPHLPSVIVQ